MRRLLTILGLPLVVCALAGVSSVVAHAQTMGLEELLATVRQSHPLFRREARTVEVERQSAARALAAQDWRFRSSVRYAYQKPPGEDLFSPTTVQSSSLQLGLEKAFWNTGGRLSLAAGQTYGDLDLRRIDFGGGEVLPGLPTAYETSAYVAYSQPLWRNWGGVLDRLEYELADDARELAAIRATEAQEAFLLEVALRYLGWALVFHQRGIVEERLALAEEQLEQVRRRREMNLVEEVDVLRARDAVHTAEQAVVQIEARFGSQQAGLAELAQRPDLYEMTPAHDLFALPVLPDSAAALREVLDRSRLLAALRIARRQIERRRAAAEETHDPDLSLDLGYGLRREEKDLGEALVISKPDAYVALNLSFPLGRRAAKAEMEQQRLLMLQVEDEIEETAIQLKSALCSLRIEIERTVEVLRLDRQRIESARQRATEERRLYDQGRGQLTFVIGALDEVERAQLTHSQNALVYQRLLLRYRELMDRLLPEPVRG